MTGAFLLDLVLVAAFAGAAVAGVRAGAWNRLLGWVGLGVALLLGARFLPDVVTTFGGHSAPRRASVAVVYLLVLAVGGHGAGTAVVARRRDHDPQADPPARSGPALAGALCGVAGAVALVWMLTPAVAAVPGWPARAMRESVVVAVIDRFLPEQPASFAAWGRLVTDAAYPPVLDALDAPPSAGPPPRNGLDPGVRARVVRSLVRVSGVACDRTQDGSGFVVRRPGGPGVLVVTNAHVVAGESRIEVVGADGVRRDARLVRFDPLADLALLDVPGWRAPALSVVAAAEPGTRGSVLGFPGGKGLNEAPAAVARRIRAVGTDIYRRSRSTRDVLVLAARLEPGDSGAPFVTRRGEVAGVAFAVDPGRRATAFALTGAEVERALERAGTATVASGRCVQE